MLHSRALQRLAIFASGDFPVVIAEEITTKEHVHTRMNVYSARRNLNLLGLLNALTKQRKGEWLEDPIKARAFGVTFHAPTSAPPSPSAPPCPPASDANNKNDQKIVAMISQVEILLALAAKRRYFFLSDSGANISIVSSLSHLDFNAFPRKSAQKSDMMCALA